MHVGGPSKHDHDVARGPSKNDHDVARGPSKRDHEVARGPSKRDHEVARGLGRLATSNNKNGSPKLNTCNTYYNSLL